MSILSKIKRGGATLPPRIVLAGPEGIGKTTFGAAAPDCLFIAAEDGLTGMSHIERFSPENFGEILTLLDHLIAAEKIAFKHIVLDTVDWLERQIHSFVCKRDNKESIEDYGYGKGFITVAPQELILLLSKLDAVREKHQVGIILLSHVHIKSFTSPDGTTWDRYEMKGNKNFTGILREWPDACLFAVHEVFKTKEKGQTKEKTVGGERIIHATWSPGWDAKNRLNLPDTLPLDYGAFAQAVSENSTENLRKQLAELLKTAPIPEDKKAAFAKVDPEKLSADKLKSGIEKLRSFAK